MPSTSSTSWSRRELSRLLVGAGAACALASPVLLAGCTRAHEPVDERAVDALFAAGIVPRHRAATRLGRLYRRRHTDESTISALCTALAGGAPPATADAWRALASRRHALDVENGRSTELDGWTMTPTEARLLALASLR